MQKVSNVDYLQLLPSDRDVMPPVIVDPKLCPTCKIPLAENSHGWTKNYSKHTDHSKHIQQFGYCLEPCPTCTGGVEQAREAQRKAARVTHLFGVSQIPFYARDWTFASFPSDGDALSRKQVQTFVRNVLADEGLKRGLWLSGAAGRCKTGLAISAMKALISRERSTLFVQTIELMNKLRSSLHTGEQDDLLKAITETDVVVLDDIATERPTAYVLEQFYYIVEKRRSNGLWTIFTSNLSTSDLEAFWRPETVQPGDFYPGLRVVERIREYCQGIAVSGRNQRG